jgi:Ca2+-transporting ATPase
VICSDKTGTLTKNEMTVRLIYDGEHTYEVTGSGYEPAGELLHEKIPVNREKMKNLLYVLRIGLLCNETNIYEEDGVHKVDGDPTEGALIVSAMKAGLNPEEEKERFPEIAIVPFESERGYMATLHNHKGSNIIYVKGAPEKVLDMCTSSMLNNKTQIKNAAHVANEFAKEGLRVIALAYKEVSQGREELIHDDIRKGLMYAGLQGMMDPPREETQRAVEGCKYAGIRTIMITGDHAVTAQAVARQVGISTDNAQVLICKSFSATQIKNCSASSGSK